MIRRFLFLVALLSLSDLVHATDRPNLVFIIADDMTFREIGCYGGQAHTPHIDRLATEGMQFSHCFQTAPMCSPTRHNIYTGLYPVRSGAYPNHTYAKKGTKSIVHYLKPLGYRVALSGKTHIGPKDVFPFEYSGKKNPDMGVIDTLFEECRDSQTPFCLFACSNEPHGPWDKGDASRYPPERIKLPPYIVDTPVVREDFGAYLAEVTYFDGQVGEIVRLLDKHNLSENTLVMVVSEQGNGFPFAKWTCYDHGLQSAMIVRWPGRVAAGSTTDALVEYCDVTSTFVDAADAEPPADVDGKSFLPVLLGEKTTHKDYSYGLMTTRGIINGSDNYPIRSVRDRQFRLIWNLQPETQFTNACSQSNFFKSMEELAESGDATAKELVHKYHFRPEFELYDCENDPMEMTNLAEVTEHRERFNILKEKLEAWMKQQGDEGIATERAAPAHQGKFKHLSTAEAIEAFEKARDAKKDQNRGRKKSKAG